MILQPPNQKAWRRFVLAIGAAVLGSFVFMQVLMPNPCRGLTPSDWEYWAMSCWAMSGAFDAKPIRFVVR